MAAQRVGVFRWMRACVVLQLCLSAASEETRRSYYDTLTVETAATDSQIKKAYRKLAVKHHPDKNKSADAEKTFREIAEAYTVLSNKERRRLYDSVGHEAFVKNEAPVDPEDEYEAGFSFGFADFFHDFDDSPFAEEPYSRWSFHQDEEDEHGPFEHYGFEEPGFSFYFGDGGDYEEEYPF